MMVKVVVPLLIISTLRTLVNSVNVLGVFPFPSKSHSILGNFLLKGLATRGHNVTMLTTHKIEDSTDNYRELLMDVTRAQRIYTSTITNAAWYMPTIITSYKAYAAISDIIFEDDAVQALINSSDKYDVVIYSHIMQQSMLGFSHRFNASSMIFSVCGVNHPMNHIMGSPQPAAYVPNIFSRFGEEMSYFQRVQNTFLNFLGTLYLLFVNDQKEQKLVKKHFPDAPSLKELLGNTQIVLVNSHISLEPIRPILQNMIHIGGYYMDNRTPLPSKVETFLNSTKRGVVYFSFGTNLKFQHMPRANIDKYLKAFEKLPYDILWKLDAKPPGTPSNVLIIPWVSQLSVLAHHNVKAFVTHGGKGGLNEAIYYGVPPLFLPCYADQIMNARDAVNAGIGLDLHFYDFTVEEFVESVKKLITNPVFKQNIMQRSHLLRNQIVHPMDLAEYWVNYVAKHRNATFLQSRATKMPWFKVTLFDVFITFFLLAIIVVIFMYFCISKILFLSITNKIKVE